MLTVDSADEIKFPHVAQNTENLKTISFRKY